MYGAILGDIIGSPYEFDMGNKSKDFPLFSRNSTYTDDTVMTIAVADAFLNAPEDEEMIRQRLIASMQRFGKLFPRAGYGGMFSRWLRNPDMKAYNSYGNGSAMRVSSVAWLFDNIEDVRNAARLSALVTHNHIEGIKGAEATASAIFLARTGHSKAEIKEYIEREFRYKLNRTCDEIRPNYRHTETCMETVPEAITAFLESVSFEDALRAAVSLGGDCDTLTDISCAIAWPFYARIGPDATMVRLRDEALALLHDDLREIVIRWEERYGGYTTTVNSKAD